MIKNYLKIAFRSMVRNKVYTLVNLFGLSTGMAVSMLIGLWIYDELAFNTSFPNYSHIALMMRDLNINGSRYAFGGAPYEMEGELRQKYSGDFSRIVLGTPPGSDVLIVDGKGFRSTGQFMGEDVIPMLSLHLLEGDPKGLHDPHSVFLSASTAHSLFGNTIAVGKTLSIDSNRLVRVTGVYEDLPNNSDFRELSFIAPLQLYVSTQPMIRLGGNPWRVLNFFEVYVQLANGADWDKVNDKIKYIRRDKMDIQTFNADRQLQFLYPMSRWHLHDALKTAGSREKIQYVWLLGFIGLFVLLLACINFMNLSTARSEKRAKEVGIRKTIGSLRENIILQFFSESLFAVGCSLILCLIWMLLLLPVFNNLTEKHLSILWVNPWFWGCFLFFGFITGIIAGLYPALYLSSFRPIQVLKGTFFRVGPGASTPRKALVVLQFTVSVFLIIGTIIVYRQIRFAQQRPVGYNNSGLVMLPLTPSLEAHFPSLRDTWKREGIVTDAALAVNTPTDYNAEDIRFNWKGKDPNFTPDIAIGNVTTEYGSTIGWQIKEGRDFSPSMPTDSSAFILNESAVQLMGFQHPIGETIEWRGMPYHVIGVIRNIIFESPYRSSSPSIFHISGGQANTTAIVLRVNPGLSMQAALARIGTDYSRYELLSPFEYRFVDQEYAKKFGEELRIGRMAWMFTLFAVMISCLGLFGMASYMAEQRRREIGIRKVLGASVVALWSLLSKEFLLLVLIALLIASPLAWYAMDKWLQQYQYRTTIDWWVFLAAGAGALGITFFTVSYQTVKAALRNPTASLRSE